MTIPDDLDRMVSTDEVGLMTARHGGYVLRSAFQLVYRTRRDRTLEPVAAEGFLRPFRGGRPTAPRPYLDGLAAEDRLVAERLGMALHAANHRHIGVEGLDHVIAVGTDRALRESLAALLSDPDIVPSRIVCSIRPILPSGIEASRLVEGEARQRGARVAIGGLEEGPPALEAVRELKPDIVRIEGAWFRRVSENTGAVRLLGRLLDGLKDEGAAVLVEGIETPRHLATALDAGADLVQGFLLSRPELAGMPTDGAHIRLADVFAGEAQVIPLFGNGGGR